MGLRDRRLEIFKQVQDGRITLDEASRLLAELEQDHGNQPDDPAPTLPPLSAAGILPPGPAGGERVPIETGGPALASNAGFNSDPTGEQPEPPIEPVEVISPRMHSPVWGGWWLLVFIPGLLLIIAAANWMYEGFMAARLGWGFWLSFIPFILGVGLVWLGWEIRLARWLSIYIRQRPGARPQEIMLSIPLPTGVLKWAMRQVSRHVPQLRGTGVGDFMNEIDQAVAGDSPLQISVGDRNGGQVEIWMDGPNRVMYPGNTS